jgi:hypothetical protein
MLMIQLHRRAGRADRDAGQPQRAERAGAQATNGVFEDALVGA